MSSVLTEHATQITEFRTRQGAAFAAERRAWGEAGEFADAKAS